MMLHNDSKPLEVSDAGCLVTLLPPSKSLHPLHQDFSCLELQEVGLALEVTFMFVGDAYGIHEERRAGGTKWHWHPYPPWGGTKRGRCN